MNILWIDHASRYDRYDDWLHWRFAKSVGKTSNIYFYAPAIHERAKNYTPILYNRGNLLKDIVSELKIDVVILDSRAAAYDNYFPTSIFKERNDNGNCWLPSDFAECKVLKLCIEEDFHYETDDKWHQGLGFKAILQKHYSQSIRKMVLPFEFFPFSVDTDVFNPGDNVREGKIGFAGTTNARNDMSEGSVYRFRESAIVALHSKGLLAPRYAGGGSHIEGKDYVGYLKQYIGYLSCGSVFNLTSAKMFEIMASGGVLFTNSISGLDVLFDSGTYVVYNNEANNIADQARKIIDNPKQAEDMAKGALDCIVRKHSNEVRVKELLNLIEKYR